MTPPRVVVTTNGPGELMGWVRPFLRAVFAREPGADVAIVFVPCAYATGREPAHARTLFPRAQVIDAKAYGSFLMGRRVAGLEPRPGVLQYLGGDLFHAVTLAKRLGLQPLTYKFSKRSYRHLFLRYFALDAKNAERLRNDGAPADRVRIVGNLVADAVSGSLSAFLTPAGEGSGICILPGSRAAEFSYLMPFFLATVAAIAKGLPRERFTFVISPFNTDQELRASVEASPDPAFGGVRGTVSDTGDAITVGDVRCAVDRSEDYRALAGCRLVITIPGTKCLEAAVLGRPMLVVLPLNRPEKIALSGIGGYLHHIPIVGAPLKARLARMVERRFEFVAQPNIDAGQLIAPELRGVLMPADVAAHAVALIDDPQRLRGMGQALAGVYAAHAGAADRMAGDVLEVAANVHRLRRQAAS